jgi:hypothetical protein
MYGSSTLGQHKMGRSRPEVAASSTKVEIAATLGSPQPIKKWPADA